MVSEVQVASNYDFYRNTYLKTRQEQFREQVDIVKTDLQLQLMLAQVYQKEIASLEDLLYKAGKDKDKDAPEKTLSGRESRSGSELSEFEAEYKSLELQRQANEDMLKRRANIYSDVQREFAPSQQAMPEIQRQGESYRIGLAPTNMETKARLAASNISGFQPGTPEAEATASVLLNTLRAAATQNGLGADFDAQETQIKAAIANTPNFAIASGTISGDLSAARQSEYERRIDTLGLGNNALAISERVGQGTADFAPDDPTDPTQSETAAGVVEQYFYEKDPKTGEYKLVNRRKSFSRSDPGTPVKTGGDGKKDEDIRKVKPEVVGDVNKDGKVDQDDVDFYADRLLVGRETEKQRQLEYPLQQLPKARARYDRAMARIDNIMSRGIGQAARENIGQETQVKDVFDQEARRQKQREAYEVMNQMKDFYNQLDDNQRYMFDAYRTGASLKNVDEKDQSYLDAQALYGVVKKDPKIDGNMVINTIKGYKKPDEVATYLGYLFAQEEEPMRFGMTRDKK